MKILVTGAAGFIGYHCCQALLEQGHTIVGIDNLNTYYDPALKKARLDQLKQATSFQFEHHDLADKSTLDFIISQAPDVIVHLAAQAGVRYSLEKPFEYTHSNAVGHLTVLEAARALSSTLRHCIYASSSSVYGEREGQFSEDDPVDKPVSLYAATKRGGELMSQAYHHLYKLPLTGLRFFTVYGEWGRPDMAYWIFSEAMLSGKPIRLFNHGRNIRDFTYIADVVSSILRMVDNAPGPRHDILNIGGSSPVETLELVRCLEHELGLKAEIEMLPAQLGDVSYTCANSGKLEAAYGTVPETALNVGIARFARWFKDYKGT